MLSDAVKMRHLIFLIILGLAITACGGGDGIDDAEQPSSTTSTTEASSTTTTQATTTTTASLSAWYSQTLEPMLREYNREFALPYQEHARDLDYSEAQLNCATSQPLLTDWIEATNPAPTAQLQALLDQFFERLAEALDGCLDAETIGDWRGVNSKLEDAVAVIERIQEETS